MGNRGNANMKWEREKAGGLGSEFQVTMNSQLKQTNIFPNCPQNGPNNSDNPMDCAHGVAESDPT